MTASPTDAPATPAVRFAPSPTGNLHIGGARTALFNFLYARANGGTFRLRIEDTDRERSTDEFLASILDAMRWLGLDWDGELVYQSRREERHREVVEKLLETGHAYRCYCTPEELVEMREKAMAEKRTSLYDGRWRDHPGPYPGRPASIRFRTPREGTTVIEDHIQGRIEVANADIDDWIVARSDGTPTYNLAVVVDDHDMAMTDVIRGDDHINNTFKQVLVYEALGFDVPKFGHVPLILGPDKTRMSKRHGATSVMQYRDEGYLPEALSNYLVRLGWSHGDQEIFRLEEMIEHFSLKSVGKSAAVFNPEKLDWLNAHWMRSKPVSEVSELLLPHLAKRGYEATTGAWLDRAVETLLERAETLEQMADAAKIYFQSDVSYDEKADRKFLKPDIVPLFEDLVGELDAIEDFRAPAIEAAYKKVMTTHDTGLKWLAQPTRIALTGGTVSPGVYDLVEVVGKETTLERLRTMIEHVRGKAEASAAE